MAKVLEEYLFPLSTEVQETKAAGVNKVDGTISHNRDGEDNKEDGTTNHNRDGEDNRVAGVTNLPNKDGEDNRVDGVISLHSKDGEDNKEDGATLSKGDGETKEVEEDGEMIYEIYDFR